METIIQEISCPKTREVLVQKSKLKLIVRDYDKAAIVSRKVKLNFADAEWWVTVGSWCCYNTTFGHYGFPVNFHFSRKAGLYEDLKSFSFKVKRIFLGKTTTCGRFKIAEIPNPWTSGATNIHCEKLCSALELEFVFTVFRVETTRSSDKSFSSSVNFNLVTANFWKRYSDPAKVDFTFVVKGKEFKVHKPILEAASPVFEGLFKSNMKESLNNSCTVDQFDPEVFGSMIKFIYESELPQNLSEISQELYKAAHYYGLEQLKEICDKEILLQLSLENAIDLYEWALVYEMEDLKKEAWKIIKHDILKIFVPLIDEPLSPELIQEIIAQQQYAVVSQQKYQTFLHKLIDKQAVEDKRDEA